MVALSWQGTQQKESKSTENFITVTSHRPDPRKRDDERKGTVETSEVRVGARSRHLRTLAAYTQVRGVRLTARHSVVPIVEHIGHRTLQSCCCQVAVGVAVLCAVFTDFH